MALADRWLTELQHNGGRSVATVDKYRSFLVRLDAWCTSPPPAQHLRPSTSDPLRLTVEDVSRFAGLFAHSTGLTPRARRPLVSALRGFYAWARKGRQIEDNPAEFLDQPKAGRPLPRAATLDAAAALLMACDVTTFLGLRDATMIALLIGCGMRVSGLVGLNDSDLIWTNEEDGERLTIHVTEKGGKERQLPVPSEAAMLLRAYLAHPDLADIDRLLPNGDAVLWVSTRNQTVPAHEYFGANRRLAQRTVQQSIEAYGAKAKIPVGMRHPHALRHLFGTELAEEEVPQLQVQALMGHSDPKSTEIYTRLAQRKLRDSVDRSNPLGKIRTPLLDSVRAIQRSQQPQTRVRSDLPARGKPRPCG